MATYKELMSGNNSYYAASRPQKAAAPKSDIMVEPKAKEYSGIERVGHTLGDFFGNIGVGIVKAGEGIVDYFAGLFGADKEKVAYDWTYEHLGKGLAEATKGSYMNGSKAGEIARSVASGVGGMLPAATANLLNLVAPGMGTALSATMFVTGAGGQGVEEAYQNGASYGKAMLYGSTVGALEGGIEALSGGIGGIGKNIGKSVGKSVAKGAGKSTAKSAIKSGVGQFAKNMVGEGVEEVASDLLNPIAKSIYTGNVDYGGVNAKSLLDTFTVGALSGGVMQGSQALVKNANTNLYVADKLSQVESINKSLDESYNVGSITEAQYAQGKADINKLLGKTSDRFAKASPSKQLKLEDYFDRKLGGAERYGLEFVKPSDNNGLTDGLAVNLPEPSKLVVTNKVNDYDKNSYSPSLLGREDKLIFKPTKVKLDDTKLAEIHTASKLLNANNSKIVVTDEIFDTDGIEGNGAYLDGDVLYVSRNANVAEQALKHEFTHRLEGTVAMDKFSKYVLDTIKASPELQAKYGSYDDRYSTTSKLYVGDNAVAGQDTTSDASKLINQELVAQYASEELFTSQKQVNRLVRASRGFAGKVVNYIQASLDKLGAKGLTPSEREAQDFLRHAESLYVKAIAKTGQSTKATSNSAEKDIDINGEMQYNNKNFSFQHKNFPGERETWSEAHRLAVWWAKQPIVETGDQTLIAMHDRWYIVEKFDDADNGYQVERNITRAEYNKIFEEINRNGKSGKIQSIQRTLIDYGQFNKRSNTAIGTESSIDSIHTRHDNENSEVLRLDKSQPQRRGAPSDRSRDSKSGGQGKQGVKFSKKATDNADQAQAVNRKAKRLTVSDTARELKEIVANIEFGEDGSNDGIRIKNKDILAAAQYITATLNSKTKSADGQVAVEVAKRLVANAYLELYTPELDECINTVKVLSKYKHKLRLDTFKADITHAFDKRTSAIMRLWGGGNVAVDDIAQDLREEGVYIESVNQVDVFLEIMDKYERAKEIVDARAELVSDKLTAREQYKLSQAIIRPLMLSFDTMRGERGVSGREAQDAITALKMQYKSRITDMKNRTRLTNSIFWQLDVVRDIVKRPSGKNPIAQEFINMANVLTTLKTTRGNFSTNARAVLDKYADIFARVRLDSDAYIEEIDAESVSMLKAFAASNGMLTTAELAGVETTLERFIFLARDGDKVFYEGKRVYAKEFAELAVEELESTAAKTKKTVLHAANKILDEMSDPRSIFERYGGYAKDGRVVGIYKELEKGVLAQMKFEQDVFNHFEAIIKELEKEKVDFRAVNIAVGENGKCISLGDAMSLILTAERSQAGKHLSNVDEERFVVEVVNDKYTAKGKYKLAVENKYDVVMSKADIARIKSGLTDRQREFLQSARVFFNEIARNAKESTDIENFGISNVVTDDSYFPEVVSKDDIYQDLYGDRANKAITVKSFGFNQSANVNANSKLVIENIFDVIARHTKQMAMYSGLTAPLKLINRVYNMKLEDGASMKTCLNQIDAGAEKYIRELLEDVQGISSRNAEDNAISNFAMALYRGGVNAALGLNPKILMTQTLSLVASLNADIKIRNIAKGMALITSKSATKDGKALLAKLYEYSPLAWDRIKSGQSMEVADAMSKGGKIAKFTTAGIGWADKKVIETLWISSLYQVSNGKSLDSLGENEFNAAAKLINETIIKTQANSHPLFNSKLKRSKSVFVKFSTMFMSDTFKQVNVFRENVNKSVYIAKEIKSLESNLANLRALSADAVDAKIVESRAEQAQELESRIAKLSAERKRAKVSASKAGAVIVVQTILLTLLAQVVKFATGKEEDDVVMDMATDFVGNVFGLFPIIRDIGSMIEGFEVSNFYESGLQNLFDATKGLTDNISMLASGQVIDQDVLFKNFRTSLLGVAQTFGVPLRNIEKYSVGVLGWADKSLQYGYYDTFKNKGSSEYRKDIEKALKRGDERLADTIINRMVKDKSVEVADKRYRDYILENRNADVAPRNINAEFSYQGKKYIADKKQDVAFREKYEPSVKQVTQMLDYKVFKDMPIDMQSKSIQFIYDYYYDIARADIVKSRATQKYDKLIFLRDVKEVALLFTQIGELRPDVNGEGKPIAGSRKNKILKLLTHYGYSREEKKLALDILGYNTDNM